jgi:hypothetical protein
LAGHVGEGLDLRTARTAHEGPPILLRNNGHGGFVDVSRESFPGMKTKLVARGIAFDDLDNDGRVDVVILNLNRPATVLRNESPRGNHWLQVRLRGVKSNRDGVGARVRVTAGDAVHIAEVLSGRGYQSHFGSRLHFGLGKHTLVDRRGPPIGMAGYRPDVPADRMVTIVEGQGLEETPAPRR